MDGMRTCVRCGLTKDESEFNWRNIAKGYLQSVCRTCQSNDSKARDREHVRISNKAAREKGRERARQYIMDYLATHPCVDCGETDVTVLTFHHKDPASKRHNVSDMIVNAHSVEDIQRELDQCEVLCANDHMRREQNKQGKGKKFWIF